MIDKNSAKVLNQFGLTMSPQQFAKTFQNEIPCLFANFVMTDMTHHIQDIHVDSSQINFLLFYPYLRDSISTCIGNTDEVIIKEIFFLYSQSLVAFWTKSLKQVNNTVDKFKHINLKSVYLNRMIVLYLIQELSADCQKRIRKNLQSSKFLKIKDSNTFVKFIIERIEVFEWKPIYDDDKNRLGELLSKRYTAETAQHQMQVIFGKAYEDLKSTPCQQATGIKGILISDPAQAEKGEYMLCTHQDTIIIVNSKYLEGWSKYEFEFKHKRIDLQLKESFQSPESSFITNALTNIGSSLGYLLANMPDRPAQFLKEFFLACTISGSMTVILVTIPILGKLILLGGLGYQAVDVLQNTDIQTRKKIEKIVGISLSMTVTVTTSVAGAVAGQILIPVPILGGFIGGVVGGLIGGLSTSAALTKFQKYKVQNMMQRLKERQNSDGSWEIDVVLDIFNLKDTFFTKYQQSIKLKDLSTLFTYFVLSLFESQRQQLQIAQLQNKCQKKWYNTPTAEEVSDIKEQIDLMLLDVPEVLLHSQVYFVVHDLQLVDNIGLLERMIEELLTIL